MTEIFDEWPEKYDRWFETPIGGLVRKYELRIINDMLRPEAGERILDAGCRHYQNGHSFSEERRSSAGAHRRGRRLCKRSGYGSFPGATLEETPGGIGKNNLCSDFVILLLRQQYIAIIVIPAKAGIYC
jgi:hypothetical protein